MAYTRRHPRTTRTDTDDHGAFQGRIVDTGAELFAMSAAMVYAQTAMREHPERAAETQELAEAFCNQAQHRGKRLFHELWSNADAAKHRLALDVLGGRHTWLEAGIVDPSAGDGPMVPSAETDRGIPVAGAATTADPRVVSPTAPTSSSSAGGSEIPENVSPGSTRTDRRRDMSKPITSLAVVGGGLMGAGIAETAAFAGMPVVVRVRELPESFDAARQRLESSLDRAVKRGKRDAAARDSALARITLTSELKDVASADLVIEAVPENVELKTSIMQALGGIVADDAVIASSTSSFSIAELASAVHNPDRVVGLHFFSPVPAMGLVEILRTLDTSDETIEKAHMFVERLGKQAIETKDRCGALVNCLLVPYLMAAVRMYEENFASREDIDKAMKVACGYPMGPLMVCDLVGLDVLYAVCSSLYQEFKRDEYAPRPLMRRMIAAGRLGRKSGRGFYDYAAPV